MASTVSAAGMPRAARSVAHAPVRRRRKSFSVRRAAFTLVGGALVLLVMVLVLTLLGVIPVRAYVVQRNELDATRARLTMLEQRNTALRERAALLRTDAEMQRLALDQFGMVRPGQQLAVIPGLRADGSVLDSTRLDGVVAPAPSATAPPKVSRMRAVLDAIQFWN